MQAFNGDPAVKSGLMATLEPRWMAGELLPLPMLKSDNEHRIYSICGVLANGQDREQFEAITGIPVDLALTCETLVGAGTEMHADENGVVVSGSASIMAAGLEWLDAIHPGTDLTNVLRQYMLGFFRCILAADFVMAEHISPATRAVGEDIADFWGREISGEIIPAPNWRAVRKAAVRASEAVSDPWEFTIAHSVESLAWPLTSLPAEFVNILQGMLAHWLAFVRLPFRDYGDQVDQVHSLVGWRRLGQAEGDLDEEGLQQLFADLPDALRVLQSAANPETRARGREANRKAREVTDPILLDQIAAVVTLIQKA